VWRIRIARAYLLVALRAGLILAASEDMSADIHELAARAQSCRNCELYKHATQTVFGEGPAPAPIMLVGEQPGDREDIEGKPFVGPAGKLLDEALEAAEIPRDQVYVTNAVKHFKWEPRGKRRLHAKPNAVEIRACHPWLEGEIAIVKPEIIVCLGATAAQALIGPDFRLTHQRGELLDGEPWAKLILATFHPSAIVRLRGDDAEFERLWAMLLADLEVARSAIPPAALSPAFRARRRTRASSARPRHQAR
jgi:DNA polymerase